MTTETQHPQSGVVLSAAGEQMFKSIIDKLEKCQVPVHAAQILVRYVDHLRHVTKYPDEPTEEMQDCVKHVLSVFPRVQAFRMLPQIFAAIRAHRAGDVDKAADTLLCVECALTLAAA